MSSNGNDERPKITEDVPEMRSVMIGSAIPAMPLRRTTLPAGKESTPKLRVSMQLNDEAPSSKESSPQWNVTAALPVPSYYDFERTHTRVKGLSPNLVSQRIDECLRENSIAATYDNDQVRNRHKYSHGKSLTLIERLLRELFAPNA